MDVPSEAENIVADYRYLGLTLGRHPLALLRQRLATMRFLSAEILNQFDIGRLVRGCGIVTVRQRIETANGVIFLTIEDESGTVNVIYRSNLVEQQRRELTSARLLEVLRKLPARKLPIDRAPEKVAGIKPSEPGRQECLECLALLIASGRQY